MEIQNRISYHPSSKSDREVYEIILDLGSRILFTKEFKKAYDQVHHLTETVADHMIDVAIVIIDRTFHDTAESTEAVDRRVLIEAALTHDLGILGRHEKYSGQIQTLLSHPKDTIRVLRDEMHIHDPQIEDAILTHMFPVTPLLVPTTREARILSMADKNASNFEMLRIPIRPKIKRWIKKAVYAKVGDSEKTDSNKNESQQPGKTKGQ